MIQDGSDTNSLLLLESVSVREKKQCKMGTVRAEPLLYVPMPFCSQAPLGISVVRTAFDL